MKYLRACINYDAIANFYGIKGQVEIYDEFDNTEYESYPTEEEMQKRVDYINNNKFTWETLS